MERSIWCFVKQSFEFETNQLGAHLDAVRRESLLWRTLKFCMYAYSLLTLNLTFDIGISTETAGQWRLRKPQCRFTTGQTHGKCYRISGKAQHC